MIDHQHDVARVFNDRPFRAHFVIIKLQQRTVGINTADPQDAEIETELGDKIQRGFANNPAVPAAQLAPGQNNAEVFFRFQRVGHVQVIGYHPQIAVLQ